MGLIHNEVQLKIINIHIMENHFKYKIRIILLLSVLVVSGPVHAYLDPGTGSLLLQGLLGGIAGAAVFIRVYWHKLTSFFKKDEENNDK